MSVLRTSDISSVNQGWQFQRGGRSLSQHTDEQVAEPLDVVSVIPRCEEHGLVGVFVGHSFSKRLLKPILQYPLV